MCRKTLSGGRGRGEYGERTVEWAGRDRPRQFALAMTIAFRREIVGRASDRNVLPWFQPASIHATGGDSSRYGNSVGKRLVAGLRKIERAIVPVMLDQRLLHSRVGIP